MCGAALESSSRRFRLASLPWAEIVLVFVIISVVTLWWSRPPADEEIGLAPLPTDIAIDIATATPPLPTPSPTPSPTVTETPIPAATPVPIVHTVRQGEVLLQIAGLYDVTLDELLAANGLSEESIIRPGDKLTIVRSSSLGGPDETFGTPAPRESGIYSYVVKKGDTIAGIAVRFQVSVEAILELNHLTTSTVIQPDQALLIPVGDVTPTPDPSVAESQASSLSAAGLQRSLSAPRLLGPAPGARFDGDVPILLRWASVGVLQEDEWYEVCIWPAGEGECSVTTAWIKATSWRVPPEVRPPAEADSHILQWAVRIVSTQEAVADTPQNVELISPIGEIRQFEWY